jgi:hypothetical protein
MRNRCLLARARMVVIQFCPNDARENREFLSQSDGRIGRNDPQAVWRTLQAEHGKFTNDVTYGRVLSTLVGIVKYGIEKTILRRPGVAPGTSLPRASATARGTGLAEDFLQVIDRFPELEGKPIVVLELKRFQEESDFLPRLAQLARDRPHLHLVPLTLERADYYRFDMHLRARGHEKVAEQLDRALRTLK